MTGGDILFGAVRALHIGGAMLLAAFPFFVLIHWRPVTGRDSFDRRMLALVLAVEIVTGVAWLWLTTAAISGGTSWAELGAVLTQTRFGLIWIVRGGLSLMLLVLLMVAGLGTDRKSTVIMLGLAGLLLASLGAGSGHAGASVNAPVYHLTVDAVHLLSGAIWPAGLVPLALFLVRRRQGITETDVAVVRRFSQASFFAVLVLVISGVVNGFLMVPSWGALVGTLYGQLLVAKVVIAVVMIALGAVSRYRFVPALAVDGPPRLVRNVAMETGLACAVLLIVGLMGMTPPPS